MNFVMVDVIFISIFWVIFSFTASMFKDMAENCGKQYPIDYVLYTNLFCETHGEVEVDE